MISKFINVFQRYTEIGFSKNLGANVLILVLNTLTGLIAARALQPQGRGIQAAIVMWPQFFAYTFTFGVSTAIIYRLNIDRTGHQAAVGTSLFLSIIYGVLAAIVGVLCLPLILKNYSGEVVKYAQLMMLFVPLVLINTTLTDIMQARQSYNILSVARITGPVISLIILLALNYLNIINPVRAALAILAPNIVLFIGNIIWLRRVMPGRFPFSLLESKKVTSIGIKFYGSHLIGTVSDQVDRIIVVGFLSAIDLGYYGIALSLSRVLNAIQTASTMSVLPKVIDKDDGFIRVVLKRAFILTLSLSTIVGIFMIITSNILISMLFGSSYLSAIPSYHILVLEAVFLGCANVLAQYFMAKGRPQINTYIIFLALALGIPIMFFLSRIYGLIGVSLGLLFITSLRLMTTGVLFLWFSSFFDSENNLKNFIGQKNKYITDKISKTQVKNDE